VFGEFTRREFFKKAGVLGTALALSGCGGSRAEHILVPFLNSPEEEVAGVFSLYASLCRMCPAGCGIMAKTMGGRVHKIEGNPRHPLNQGRLCARGQAGLQVLYNPDRLTGPQARGNGRGTPFQTTTWDDGVKRLTEALKKASAGGKGRVAVYGGQLPDQTYRVAALLLAGLDGVPVPDPFAYYVGDLSNPQAVRLPVVWNLQRACDADRLLRRAMDGLWGEPRLPLFDMGAADVVLSFSADLFETWLSPVYFGRGYGALRRRGDTSRGYFVQVQPRLSVTGVSADEWLAPPPGREAEVALVLGRVILDEGLASPRRPAGIDAFFEGVDGRALSADLGLSFESLVRLARTFGRAVAPLAIPGGGLGAYRNADAAVNAVLALDLLVGAQGRTLSLSPAAPSPELAPTERVSPFSEVQSLVADMAKGGVDVLLVLDGDPVHDLPAALGFQEAAAKVPLIVDFSSLPTDTGDEVADLRLPSPTYLETWGYQVPQPGSNVATLGGQQPVARQLYDTRSPVDVLLAAAKGVGGATAQLLPWDSEVALIEQTVAGLEGRPDASILTPDPTAFYIRWQQFGGWWSTQAEKPPGEPKIPEKGPLGPGQAQTQPGVSSGGRTFLLYIYPSMFLGEGRGANLPWLQAGADTMTTVMWESWIELNPAVATDLGAKTGDLVKVTSAVGSVEVPVYVYMGIGPDMVAMPLGQGHTHSGRYASNRGVNAADLLTVVTVDGAGELAWGDTVVTIEKTGGSALLPRLEGSDSTVLPEGL
jgi:anaerobic selenocysteine-containing dehydrogenase